MDALGNPILGPGGLPLPVDSTVQGMAGNDSLSGGLGNDSLLGGTGDDIYIVNNISDSIIERTNEGNNQILTSIGYTLICNIENLTLTGAAVINGTGNDSNNVITGNTRNKVLSGLASDDTFFLGGRCRC